MCQTEIISQSITRLSKRTFARRLDVLSPQVIEHKGTLTRLNNELDDLYDLFSIKGECDAATISGWVLEQVGRVPEVGDHFEAEGLDVTVTQVEHRRVLEIRVMKLPESEEHNKSR